MLGRDTESVPESIDAQTRLVLEKVEAILLEQGLDRTSIVKTTAFITDLDNWGKVNDVYKEFFGDYRPARSIIPCGRLHHGCLIELEAIAAK